MAWRKGDRVRHPKQLDWGPGEVLSVEGDKLRIRFEVGGERVFVAGPFLEKVEERGASRAGPEAAPAPEVTSRGAHGQRSVEEARRRYKAAAGAVEIESQRSARVDVWGPCSVCDVSFRPLWFYARASCGALYLCVPCKDRLLEGAEDRKDVLDLTPRLVERRAFQGNRHRH